MQPEGDMLPVEVAAAAARLDELVKKFEEHPDLAVRDRVFELLRCVDLLHRAGLGRLNELLKVAGLQQRAIDDPEVRLLFDVYDLGEGGDLVRAQAVIESMQPALRDAGAALEIVEAGRDRLRVRLELVPDAAVDTPAAIEQALRDALPEVEHLELVLARPPVTPEGQLNFVPLSTLTLRRATWRPAADARDMPVGTLRAVAIGDARILLARLSDSEVYAYRNACPGTPFPLEAGVIANGTLRCPWHGCVFDLRGGRRLDTDGPGLGVIPVRIDSGAVCVQLPAGAAA